MDIDKMIYDLHFRYEFIGLADDEEDDKKTEEMLLETYKYFDRIYDLCIDNLLYYIYWYQRQYLTKEQLEKLDYYIMMQKLKW